MQIVRTCTHQQSTYDVDYPRQNFTLAKAMCLACPELEQACRFKSNCHKLAGMPGSTRFEPMPSYLPHSLLRGGSWTWWSRSYTAYTMAGSFGTCLELSYGDVTKSIMVYGVHDRYSGCFCMGVFDITLQIYSTVTCSYFTLMCMRACMTQFEAA